MNHARPNQHHFPRRWQIVRLGSVSLSPADNSHASLPSEVLGPNAQGVELAEAFQFERPVSSCIVRRWPKCHIAPVLRIGLWRRTCISGEVN